MGSMGSKAVLGGWSLEWYSALFFCKTLAVTHLYICFLALPPPRKSLYYPYYPYYPVPRPPARKPPYYPYYPYYPAPPPENRLTTHTTRTTRRSGTPRGRGTHSFSQVVGTVRSKPILGFRWVAPRRVVGVVWVVSPFSPPRRVVGVVGSKAFLARSRGSMGSKPVLGSLLQSRQPRRKTTRGWRRSKMSIGAAR